MTIRGVWAVGVALALGGVAAAQPAALRLPPGTIVLEAEGFALSGMWVQGTTHADLAAGGLSGGAELNSNARDAVATKTVEVPSGQWTLWARVFDWGGAPGHYELRLEVNGRAGQIAVTEPLTPSFVWERWGPVEGGKLDIRVTEPDGFNACLDCLALIPEAGFVPANGPAVRVAEATVTGRLPGEPAALRVKLRIEEAAPAPKTGVVAVARLGPQPGSRRIVWSRDFATGAAAGEQWAAGRTVALPEVSLPPLPHLWPGRYGVYVAVAGTTLGVGEQVTEFQIMETADMPQPVRAEVRSIDGSPTLLINGRPDFPFAYVMAAGDANRQYGQMAEAGVRFFTMGAGIGNGPQGFEPTGCDDPFLDILRHQPRALMFPRVDVTAPEWWLAQHPEERVRFDDGATGPQSMFSEAWLREACRWIEEYARHVRRSPYADHVMGIHICSGVSAEWQSWGLWSDQRGDLSAPARRAWREYLRAKYGSDRALAAAWGREAALETAAMPSRQRRETPTGFFRLPGEYQDISDFYDFYWRGTARAIEALAAAAKRGGGSDWLVGFFYGYAIQYGGVMQESQHLGLREVMNCPDIDFFCSPAMYSQRHPGGTSTFMSFTESLKARGKLWFHEADNRTHLSADRLLAAEDLTQTRDVLKREFAHVVASRAGLWWFDMQGGWYDDPAVLSLLRAMREFGESNPSRWQPRAEVAVFIDDKSSYRLPPGSEFLNGLTQLMALMPRLGAPYDTYLLSDLRRAGDYKMVILPLAFDLTDGERAALNDLKRAGRTLVFMGPAGIGRVSEGRVSHEPGLSAALLGLTPEGEGWRTAGGVWWTSTPNPPMSELRRICRRAGVHLYSNGSDALYAGNGLIALHARSAGTKTLVFPQPVRVRELFGGETAAATVQRLSLPMRKTETRCFAVEAGG